MAEMAAGVVGSKLFTILYQNCFVTVLYFTSWYYTIAVVAGYMYFVWYMYQCVYIYIYTYIYICTYICTYIYMYILIYLYVSKNICIHIYMYIHMISYVGLYGNVTRRFQERSHIFV